MSDIALAPPDLTPLPTQADLPCDDGIPMETQRHKVQMDMLIEALEPWLAKRADGYAGGNMFVYFSANQVKNQDYRGPDFFAVLDVPKGERLSWVIWEEGKGPDIVIELLSESTAKVDKTDKKRIYQNQMQVPEYIWFDPFNPEDWAGFALHQGTYRPLQLNAQGQMVSQVLGLTLVLWHGNYQNIEDVTWLRWATLEGELLPLFREKEARERQEKRRAQQRAEQEHQRAEQEHQRAEQEHQRAEQEHQRAEQEQQRAEQEQQRAEQEQQRAEQEQQRAEQEQQRAEQEQQRAEQAESQLQQLVLNLLAQGMTVEQVSRLAGLDETQVKQMENVEK